MAAKIFLRVREKVARQIPPREKVARQIPPPETDEVERRCIGYSLIHHDYSFVITKITMLIL
jgi:hypothetical protein